MSIRRTRYFINPKVQLKYMIMSVMPALIMVLLTTYFLVKSTEIKLCRQKEATLAGMSSLDLQVVMEHKQINDLEELNKSRNLIILALFAALIFSQRIYVH